MITLRFESTKAPPFSWRRRIATILVLGTVPLWYFPLSWWLAMSPNRLAAGLGSIALAFDLFIFFAFLGSVVFLLGFPLLVLFRASRKLALHFAALATLFVPCFLGGVALGQTVWKNGINRFVMRSKPLVAAISAYEAKHGAPPASLEELVPVYLKAVPSPGLGPSDEFIYTVGAKAWECEGNPWVLRVPAPSLPMGFDQVYYFPKQNYPRVGYGGGIERIGGWGYVHE